ncbi:MAG: hypothetical protein WC906_02075 [Parcubacteria group bacterium]
MSKLSRIFKEMKQIEPKAGLNGLILQKIGLEKSRQIKRKLILSYSGMAGSLSAAVYALIHFGSAFLKSEFWSILSLAFSDFMVVAGSWKEYLYSLGETLPIVNIVAILVPIFGILMFLNLYFSLKKNYKHINNHFKFI